METGAPTGFTVHERTSPLTAPWEPIFVQRDDDGLVTLAVRVGQPHTNSRGFAHGGLMSTLSDNAMGLSCAARHEDISGLVTVSLNLDYMGSARIGQWLEVRTTFVKVGRSLDFAQCFVHADDTVCARGSASFRVLPRRGEPRETN